MEAANAGAKEGGKKSKSFGLRIDLPFESDFNSHLDIKFFHKKFSSRLDEFMRLSNAIIVAPGGIGTLLELYYAWQLIQVGHIKERPIILVGNMWRGLIDWMKESQLNNKLIDKKDIDQIQIVDKMEEVVPILQKEIEVFYKVKL
jgi:predicted Rossmann-fold nucleotide-binding protein